jgi:hypothetical protein
MERIPQFVAKGLLALGGYAPNGQARLRLVWGGTERCWRAGRSDAVKYPHPDTGEPWPVWVLEQWYPVESEAEWHRQRYRWDGLGRVDLLGPYPAGGHYLMHRILFDRGGNQPMRLAQWGQWLLNELAAEKQAGEARSGNMYDSLKDVADYLAYQAEIDRQNSEQAEIAGNIAADEWNTNWPKRYAEATRKSRGASTIGGNVISNFTETPGGLIVPA